MADDGSPGGIVVILFGGTADGWCTLDRCPLGTAEWFPDREAADAYCATLPEMFQPHMLVVRRGPA